MDYFVKRLRKGNVRNPIAYFAGLTKRWLKGKLDMGDEEPTNFYIPPETTTPEKTQQQQEIERRMEYQDAYADLEQMKEMINRITDDKRCSFEEALKELHYTDIWEKAVERLERTRRELQAM